MKQLIYTGLIILLTACGSDSDSSDGQDSGYMDWRLFRGDAAFSGYTDTRLPENPILLWVYRGDFRTASSPIIDNGTTYWCDKKGFIRGVNINGTLIFEYDLQTAVEATPMIYDSVLYIGRIDGKMTAISLSEKDTIWNYETMGQIAASPNSVNFKERQAILFGSYDNFLYCVDYKDGTEINRFESGYYLNGAVAVRKKFALFGGCDSWLRIIDCQTGVQTDSLLLEAYIPASPAIMGNYCYIGDYSGNIYELQLKDGQIVRHKKIMSSTNKQGAFVSVPAITGETLYFLADDRHLYAVDRKDGTVNWKYMLKGNVGESSPVICRDKVLICTKTGVISILDADNGEPEWEYDAGEQIVGSPAVIKNHFFVLTAKGTLLCFGNRTE
ncbi:MAG: PQQ-binding-like beta-propeller repeat protein [Tannerella sp.]|jgi:outer membrane protein assembly factor BamB|nr:PQQ-binding-like beta-propeller repeat protein [Tannerella sp.]